MCITRQHPLTNHATFSHNSPHKSNKIWTKKRQVSTSTSSSTKWSNKLKLYCHWIPLAKACKAQLPILLLTASIPWPWWWWKELFGDRGGRGWPGDGEKTGRLYIKTAPQLFKSFHILSKRDTNGLCPKDKEMGENPSRIPKNRKRFQHVGSRCRSIWGGSFFLLPSFYTPLKKNGDFLTTMVAVGCDVGLMQGESSHFMAFHGDFPISPLFLLRDKAFQGGLEFGVHTKYIWWRCMEWNLILMNHVWPIFNYLEVSQIVIFLIDMLWWTFTTTNVIK